MSLSPDQQAIIDKLDLAPLPDGSWLRQTYGPTTGSDDRGPMTAIIRLVPAGILSHWHRLDADELFHWYAGAPYMIESATESGIIRQTLGPDISGGMSPQILVPAGIWQRSGPAPTTSGDGWTLIGATVAPGWRLEGSEKAPEGWSPAGV